MKGLDRAYRCSLTSGIAQARSIQTSPALLAWTCEGLISIPTQGGILEGANDGWQEL